MAERKSFGSLKEILDIPDLISVQVDSYNSFLQSSTLPEERKEIGLESVLKEVMNKFEKS